VEFNIVFIVNSDDIVNKSSTIHTIISEKILSNPDQFTVKITYKGNPAAH